MQNLQLTQRTFLLITKRSLNEIQQQFNPQVGGTRQQVNKYCYHFRCYSWVMVTIIKHNYTETLRLCYHTFIMTF